MKKMLIVIAMFFVLISGVNVDTSKFSLVDYFSGELYTYSNSPISDNYVNLGTCYMNLGNLNNKNLIIGESMEIENFEPSSALHLLKATVLKTEYLDSGATVIYAYSNLIPKSVKVDGQKVNLQIAYYEEYSIIGWPLILGSY